MPPQMSRTAGLAWRLEGRRGFPESKSAVGDATDDAWPRLQHNKMHNQVNQDGQVDVTRLLAASSG